MCVCEGGGVLSHGTDNPSRYAVRFHTGLKRELITTFTHDAPSPGTLGRSAPIEVSGVTLPLQVHGPSQRGAGLVPINGISPP